MAIAVLVVLGAPLSASDRAPAALGVEAIGLTVSDLDRSLAFYRDVLGFRPEGPEAGVEVWGADYEHLFNVFGMRARVARLGLGDERIDLIEFLTPRGLPAPADTRSNDEWFQHIAIITSDMDRAYAHLRAHGVEHVSPGPQRLPDWNPSAGGIVAFYFHDPDDHPLEILQFPPGKGAAKWHREDRDELFLGIDHTAIVVEDTEQSLAFYTGLLGFDVAGQSENYGPEQERLNQVFGARLRITGLRLATGPAIEFLDYLTPDDGRPRPANARANDLLYWQTTIAVDELSQTMERLKDGYWVSPGVVELEKPMLGFVQGALVRDPDGHVLQLVDR